MTPAELAELKRLAEAATPGPWTVVKDELLEVRMADNQDAIVRDHSYDGLKGEVNMPFIAALNPDTVLRLLGIIQRQAAQIEKLESVLRRIEDYCLDFDWIRIEILISETLGEEVGGPNE